MYFCCSVLVQRRCFSPKLQWYAIAACQGIVGEEFMVKLGAALGEGYVDFEALDNTESASFVLGCELWTKNLDFMLAFVKST